MTEFRATTSTTQAVTIQTLTEVNFGTELFDTDSVFASNRCTVPAGWNGTYGELYAGLDLQTPENGYLGIQVSTNGGGAWTTIARQDYEGTSICAVQTGARLMNTSDIYRVVMFAGTGSSVDFSTRSFFSGRIHNIGGIDSQSYFRAYASSGQAIPESIRTPVAIDTTVFDTGVNLTGGAYKVPVPLNGGHGIFTGGISSTAGVADDIAIYVTKSTDGGSTYPEVLFTKLANGGEAVTASTGPVALATGEKYRLEAFSGSAGGYPQEGSERTFFSGEVYKVIPTQSISAITQANPAVVTIGSTADMIEGETITITGVSGMVEITDGDYTCSIVDGTDFQLTGIDSTGYTAYTTGGVVSGIGYDAPAAPSAVTDFMSIVEQPGYVGDMVADMTAMDSSGNVYVAANSTLTGLDDISLTKYAADGTITWRYSYPNVSGAAGSGAGSFAGFEGLRVSDIKTDPSGNVFVCVSDPGAATPGGSGVFGAYTMTLIKFDSAGDILWQRTFSDPAGEFYFFGSLAVDVNGAAFVMFAGRLDVSMQQSATNTYIAKYNAAGSLIWEQAWRNTDDASGEYVMKGDMITDGAGNVYAQWLLIQRDNVVTVKLNGASGAPIWENYYHSAANPELLGAAEVAGLGISADGSTLIHGYSFSVLDDRQSMLVKLNASTGAEIENRTVGTAVTPFHSRIYDVKIDPATDLVYVFGSINASGGLQATTPYLMVMDLSFSIQYYHEYTLSPLGTGSIRIDYDHQTYSHRGPRISIGTDAVAIAYLHDDNNGVNGLLMHFNKDGSSLSAGALITSPTAGTAYSLATVGAPALAAGGALTDAAGVPSPANTGEIQSITSGVTQSAAAIFGAKAALGATALPVITLL